VAAQPLGMVDMPLRATAAVIQPRVMVVDIPLRAADHTAADRPTAVVDRTVADRPTVVDRTVAAVAADMGGNTTLDSLSA
jgi:hypothetical protein